MPIRRRCGRRIAVPEIEWKTLRDNAFRVMRHAYAPYSRFPVGAAALRADGSIAQGCNVENVSYGLGLCAECVLVGNHQSAGGGRLLAVSVCDSRGEILLPCGRCRQVLYEFGGAELLVDHRNGPVRLGGLLADAFGPDDLNAGRI
ncbi:cytidine deaminase [Nocardia paucivorans]|uniref:cytidine deaminase n=1 Tax=Nocardia paucivorans TaxID=114259 RepID=UPI0006867170